MRRLAVIAALAVIAGACGATTDPTTPPTSSSTSEAPEPAPVVPGSVDACDTISPVAAPEDWYRDTPVYVANEQPVEAVAAWAATRPGYQSIWVDRDRNGWITVAFDRGAAERQADLLREFPDVGVVAVEVDWDVTALRALQDRVVGELRGTLPSFTVSTAETKGVVVLGVGVLTDQQRAEIHSRYADLPVCLSEPDPSTIPEPGPQPIEGDGWRLLAAEKGVGRTYHTSIATDADSLAAMWSEIGLDAPLPEVDFEGHVVVWFGAVFGSGCDDLRLDDVVVDGTTVYADIVLVDPPAGCAGDANPFALVVAIERSALPAGPFAIQLDSDGPPGGVPEERLMVAADLSVPGSVVRPEQLSRGLGEPRQTFVESGAVIEPGFPQQYRMYVHCGINWLGELNGVEWFTADDMPAEWSGLVTDKETLLVSITLQSGPPPALQAVANGVAVLYEPAVEPPPACD